MPIIPGVRLEGVKRMLKKHLKLKNKALCGIKKQKHKLQFAEKHEDVTCGRCIAAIAR